MKRQSVVVDPVRAQLIRAGHLLPAEAANDPVKLGAWRLLLLTAAAWLGAPPAGPRSPLRREPRP